VLRLIHGCMARGGHGRGRMARGGRGRGRMARGGHGLPKVSPGPAMPDSSTPCGRATALQPFRGWPTHRVGGLRLFSTLLETPRHTHIYIYI
jgi:hypothetical protein